MCQFMGIGICMSRGFNSVWLQTMVDYRVNANSRGEGARKACVPGDINFELG